MNVICFCLRLLQSYLFVAKISGFVLYCYKKEKNVDLMLCANCGNENVATRFTIPAKRLSFVFLLFTSRFLF